MIETETYYKIRLTQEQARQLYRLLQTEKDSGGLSIDGNLCDLRKIYAELKSLLILVKIKNIVWDTGKND